MEPSVSGVGVLDKSLAVVESVAGGAASLSQVMAATGLPKATAHRLVVALEAQGLLRRSGETIGLGLRLRTLGRQADQAWPLADRAAPVLAWLRDETGESAQLYVCSGPRRLCVASLESLHELRTTVEQGALLPLDAGSGGRLLRWAEEVGTEAVAQVRPRRVFASAGERAPGVASVSAPAVVDGEVVALSVSGPIDRTGRRPGPKYGPAVTEAADRLERQSTR